MLGSASSRRGLAPALLLAVLVVFAVGPAQATPGGLDGSFGSGGKVVTAIGSRSLFSDVVVQPDGKIVAVGESSNVSNPSVALARFNPNGSLDSSFGSAGVVTTAIGAGRAVGNAVALQPDGKIVVAGGSGTDAGNVFALVRYNPDGSLDPSFGSGGIARTSPSYCDAASVAIQPDGRIVVAGAVCGVGTSRFALVRYRPDGSLDQSFGSGGVVTTAFGPSRDGANAVALQPDGKIVAAGFSNGSGPNDIGTYDFALARYNADGSLDTSFNSSGKVTTPIGPGFDEAFAVAVEPDGKIVAIGEGSRVQGSDFALVRYNPDGSLDSSFGAGGKVTTAIGSSFDSATSAALQPDGKIVAVGSSRNGVIDVFALARYNPDGSLDTSFNGSGKVTTTVGSAGPDQALAATLQPNGKIIAAGFTSEGVNRKAALVRYLASTLLGSTLSIAKTGSGGGQVTSSPRGIDCGPLTTCSYAFVFGTSVTLTATPSTTASPVSRFAGWSGDCAGRDTCTLTMSADHAVTATFDIAPPSVLTVVKNGNGSGNIRSLPPGIDCGPTCSHAYGNGTTVQLTATASSASSFGFWSGDCFGTYPTTGTCTLKMKMNTDYTVGAVFELKCIVPNLNGITRAAAETATRRAHCSPGRVKTAPSAKFRKGRVISQTPKPGVRLPPASKVNIVVSKGKHR
jgi:uncharacterized delta-60 repeat protein